MSDPVRLQVRLVRGRIVPCTGCKRIYNCAMYQSFTRKRMRDGQYLSATNILHECEIYTPDRIPGNIKAPQRISKTSGQTPT